MGAVTPAAWGLLIQDLFGIWQLLEDGVIHWVERLSECHWLTPALIRIEKPEISTPCPLLCHLCLTQFSEEDVISLQVSHKGGLMNSVHVCMCVERPGI